jgi:hypothetical protein
VWPLAAAGRGEGRVGVVHGVAKPDGIPVSLGTLHRPVQRAGGLQWLLVPHGVPCVACPEDLDHRSAVLQQVQSRN